MGAEVTVCGPPTLIPRDFDRLGCRIAYSLDEVGSADVIYALRMQNERMTGAYVPSLREYAANYQIDGRRLGAGQLLMHPGPVNRGVELASEVIDSPQALITQQVESGVVVRMAVLYELLAGSGAPDAGRGRSPRPSRWERPDGAALRRAAARLCGARGHRRRDPRRAPARPARRARRASRTSCCATARSPR